ncbi:MAG: hypothetical protein QOG00_3899 [Pyrinomonadaceae bacterium]|nr:hypothetical protein [Pyrinomonadaceae bacterium]
MSAARWLSQKQRAADFFLCAFARDARSPKKSISRKGAKAQREMQKSVFETHEKRVLETHEKSVFETHAMCASRLHSST